MDDIMNKINKILSDPESIKQISELAQMFMSETGNNNKSSNASDSNPDNSENSSDSDRNLPISDAGRSFTIQNLLLCLRITSNPRSCKALPTWMALRRTAPPKRATMCGRFMFKA